MDAFSKPVTHDAGVKPPALAARVLADVSSGTLAACIVTIQAMAFGIALYAPYSPSAAAGAGAGLVCAVLLCLGSGLMRGTVGIISAPTGPTLVMLTVIAANLADTGLHGSAVISALGVVVALSGLMQIVLGLSGGGRLVKLVPLPVTAGFMTGSGVLMIASQLVPATGGAASLDALSANLTPLMTTVLTLVSIVLCKRFLTVVPPVLMGLVVGTLAFHVLAGLRGNDVPSAWLVGALPDVMQLELQWPAQSWTTLPWTVIVVSALFLAVFTALDTLLTSLVADTETEQRHDARQELAGQGLGHVVSGLFGGMAGAGTTAATVANIASGGRTYSPLVCAVAVVLALAFGRDLTTWLPIGALAGVIIYVAWGLFEPAIVMWWRRPRTRTDALVAVLVAVVTVALDLMLAVALGFGFAALRFIVTQMRSPVVHQRIDTPSPRVDRQRNADELSVLERPDVGVVLYELRGTIVFATAEGLFEELSDDIEAGARIILSFRRVSQVDLTGLSILRNMCQRARSFGGEIVFANVRKKIGVSRKVDKAFRRAGFAPLSAPVRTFQSTDVALERLEDELLEAHGMRRDLGSVALGDSQLCTQMSAAQIETLAQHMERVDVTTGTRVYESGQPSTALYVVMHGSVDIRLPTGRHHWSRIARIGPGMLFGEVSFHTPGLHTATAVATEDGTLYRLSRDAFARIKAADPALAVSLLEVLGQIMGKRLRRANAEINRLNRF